MTLPLSRYENMFVSRCTIRHNESEREGMWYAIPSSHGGRFRLGICKG